MFDSLYVPCGNCGKAVEFQSKAGECTCASYTIYDCPPAIAGDLIGQSHACDCGAIIQILGEVSIRHETRDGLPKQESKMTIEEAAKIVRQKWKDNDGCRSCGFKYALYELEPIEQRITDKNLENGYVDFYCSGSEGDETGHRGARVYFK